MIGAERVPILGSWMAWRSASIMYGERGGSIPSGAYYDKFMAKGRLESNSTILLYRLSIRSKGKCKVTPLQMANLAAIFDKKQRNFYYKPHLVKNTLHGDKKNINS